MQRAPVATDEQRRVAKMKNWLNKAITNEEIGWPWRLHTWPRWAQLAWLAPHLKRTNRYKLFYFFAFNGMPPNWAAIMTLMNHINRNGQPETSGYDENALRQVDEFIVLHNDGRLYRS